MNRARIRIGAVLLAVMAMLLGGHYVGGALATPAAATGLPGQPNGIPEDAQGTGTRFNTGNICLEDWTNGYLDDGLKHAAVQWSRSSDLNLYYRTDCAAAGFPESQTITVVTVFQTGVTDCAWAIWWTKYGAYAIGDPITRAVIQVNRAAPSCVSSLAYRQHLAVHEVGHELGLEHPYTSNASVMGTDYASWQRDEPTAWDFWRIDRVYPW